MAIENVTANSGTGGAKFATDQIVEGVDTLEVPYAKLMSGTDASKELIGGDAANGLDVDVTRLPAPLTITGGGVEASALRVTLASDSTGVLSVDDNGGALTVDGTVTANLAAGTNNIGDVDVLTLPALPAGTNNIGDVDVASVIPGTGATNLGKAEDAIHGSGDVGVMALAVRNDAGTAFGADGDYSPMSLTSSGALRISIAGGLSNPLPVQIVAGAASIGTLGANSGVDIGDVDVLTLPAIPAGANTIGAVNVKPATSGGLSISRTISAATTNATSVKASAGQVFGWYISNVNAAARFVKLYNKASAPTVGTDTPVMTIAVPGNTAGAGSNVEFTNGIAFGTGIALAITGAVTDADTTAVAANEIVVNLLFA